MRTAFVLALALVVTVPAVAPAQPTPQPASGPFDGLNLLLTRKRLQEIQDALQRNDPLATRARDDAVAEADKYLTVAPNPIKGVLKVPGYYTKQQAVQQQIAAQLRGDARAAHALAMGYALTGKQAYADKARDFIFAWVGSLTRPVDGGTFLDWFLLQHGGDTALVMSYSFPAFFYAYDILRGFGQIGTLEHQQFKTWLAPFVKYHTKEEVIKNNHHNWQTLFLLAAAHVTEDRGLFDRAIGYYKNGMEYQIARDGAMWRELVRGEKAATYTLMAVEAMVQFVTIAENHGYTGLRGLVSKERGLLQSVILKLRTLFKSTGVPKDGGDLRAALGSLRDFVNDPAAWQRRYQNTIKAKTVNGPAKPSDWGWLFEVASAWFQDPSFLPLMSDAPYGLAPARAYTLAYATLHFRRW